MRRRPYFAYAHGKAGDWEGLCLDLDIAVQGTSFEEVRDLLIEAVSTYAEDARKESPRDARHLLSRRAPLATRVKYIALFLAHLASTASSNAELRAGFDLPCPA